MSCVSKQLKCFLSWFAKMILVSCCQYEVLENMLDRCERHLRTTFLLHRGAVTERMWVCQLSGFPLCLSLSLIISWPLFSAPWTQVFSCRDAFVHIALSAWDILPAPAWVTSVYPLSLMNFYDASSFLRHTFFLAPCTFIKYDIVCYMFIWLDCLKVYPFFLSETCLSCSLFYNWHLVCYNGISFNSGECNHMC